MIQRIIKSNSILLAPLRALFFPDFYSYIRGVIFQSHSRLKLSLLRNIHENEKVIKATYIWDGFNYAVNVALGLDSIDDEL